MFWEKTLDGHHRTQVAHRDHLVHHISDKGPSSLYPEPFREGKLQRDCRGSAHLAWTSFLLLWTKRDSPLQRLVLAFQPSLPWQPPGLSRCSTSPLEGFISAPPVSVPTLPPLTFGGLQVCAVQVSNDPSPLASSQLHLSRPSRSTGEPLWIGGGISFLRGAAPSGWGVQGDPLDQWRDL